MSALLQNQNTNVGEAFRGYVFFLFKIRLALCTQEMVRKQTSFEEGFMFT